MVFDYWGFMSENLKALGVQGCFFLSISVKVSSQDLKGHLYGKTCVMLRLFCFKTTMDMPIKYLLD